jgi:hypothetical protein
LLFGITWLIALVLSLTYKSKNIIENNDLDRLEKLANLKERGILTQEEFEKEKNKLLDK